MAKFKTSIWITIFALTCAALAYGIHWERGPHHDDYFLYSWSAKQLVNWIWVEVRPIGKLFMVVIYQSPELFARILAFALIAGTAVLAALIVYRTTRQLLAAIVVGLICLAPFTGAEAVTWNSAWAHFLPAGFFALSSIHVFLSALRAQRIASRRILGLISVVLLSLAFGSIEPALNFYLMFFALILYVYPENRQQFTANLRLLLESTAVLLVILAIIYFTFYIDASQVSRRGTIEIPSLDRIIEFLYGFYRRAFGSTFGLDIQYISYREGIAALLSSPIATFLGLLAVTAGILAVIDWPRLTNGSVDNSAAIRNWQIAILIVFSLATTLATMLFPSVLLSNEHGSPRLAYLPGVSFALTIGFGIAALSKKFHTDKSTRIILAVSLFCVSILTLRTLGYTKMYQLRQELDQQQVLALKAAVPPGLIANARVAFLPLSISEEFISYHVRTDPRYILIGAFTSPNSVSTILRSIYPNATIDSIRPRYGELRWVIEPSVDGNAISILGLESDGSRIVNPDELIIFRYRKDGTIDIAEKILYQSEAGDTVRSVLLPWATRISDSVGTPTFSLNLPLTRPEYVAARE